MKSSCLVEAISKFSNGATLNEVVGAFPEKKRGVLQKQLRELLKEGYLTYFKKRYHLPCFEKSLSPIAESHQLLLNYQRSKKLPVPYDFKLIHDYRPNHTFYLSERHLQELHSMARPKHANPKHLESYIPTFFPKLVLDFAWNSCRLEKSLFTLLETQAALDGDSDKEGAQHILNQKAALEFLLFKMEKLDEITICNLHATACDNFFEEPENLGKVRRCPVHIRKSPFIPLNEEEEIKETFELVVDKAASIVDPFEQSFFLMVHIPYLQPFNDGNKRLSRLLANYSLLKAGLCPISFARLPQKLYGEAYLALFELKRLELLKEIYILSYRESCRRYIPAAYGMGKMSEERFSNRHLIKRVVEKIVRMKLNAHNASHLIRDEIKDVSFEEQATVASLIEQELLSLHKGNIGRFDLTLECFEEYKKVTTPDCTK